MNHSQAARVVWREWATCDFRDDDYLMYLFGLVGGRPGGLWGAALMGTIATLWAPLALFPLCLFVSWMMGPDQDPGSALTVANAATLVAYATAVIAVLGVLGGRYLPRRNLFLLVKVAPVSAITPYISILVATIALGLAAVVALGLGVGFWIAEMLGRSVVCGILVFIAGGIAISPFLAAAVIAEEWSDASALELRDFCKWWRGRPDYLKLEQALALLDKQESPLQQGTSQDATEDALAAAINDLSSESWRARFQGRHTCIRLGGLTMRKLMEPLETSGVHPSDDAVRSYVMRSICRETTRQLRDYKFLCPACHARVVRQSALRRSYYGCRRCGRSHDVIRVFGRVICVVGGKRSEPIHRDGLDIHIHWSAGIPIPDSERVEFLAGTDEDVERFVMTFANETDAFRRRLVAQATCRVSSKCTLNTNTMRLLSKTFGRLETQGERPSTRQIQSQAH